MDFRDELCFVQFIHPGGEHRPDGHRLKNWNRGPHKRKFVENFGRCVRSEDDFEGLLRFWTEWEPQAEVSATIKEQVPDGPRYVYKPFCVVPQSYDGLQNTDPFVFGNFFYTGCQQHTKRGPTQLRYLERGSVILFGSCVRERFAIDTVFVVDRWVDHNASDVKRLFSATVPEIYREVTLDAWYADGDSDGRCTPLAAGLSFRLYWGATIADPVDGMFSFFPCMPAKTSPNGFARPVIINQAVITAVLRQGKRLNRGIMQCEVAQYWKDVCAQVESAGLWLGVYAEQPKRVAR